MDAKLLGGWMRKKEMLDVNFLATKRANDHEKCEPTTTYCFKWLSG
jgi:hypothetical protein